MGKNNKKIKLNLGETIGGVCGIYLKSPNKPSPSQLGCIGHFVSRYMDLPGLTEGGYNYFEDKSYKRKLAEKAFTSGRERLPLFDYPRLDHLYDEFPTGKMYGMATLPHEEEYESLLDMKGYTYKAMSELDAAAKIDPDRAVEYTMYADVQESNLSSIHLVEAAWALREDNSDINRRSWQEANERCFGEFNKDYFRAILDGSYKEIFDQELLLELKQLVETRYAAELAAVPDTPDDVYYDSSEIKEICDQAMADNGMADSGVGVEIRESTRVPDYVKDEKKLLLPPDMSRNAAEIRRFIVHEFTHVRRNLNGIETGVPLLANGTTNYLAAEEGVNVILECAVEGNFDNASFDRAVERYIVAGFALGADEGGSPRDARETYEASWQVIAERLVGSGEMSEESIKTAQDRTWKHIENAFRGTGMYQKGIIYMKLKVYYEGLVKNMLYFKKHSDNLGAALDRAMIGKYDHTSDEEYESVVRMIDYEKKRR